MIEIKYTGDSLWERVERAAEKVKDRVHIKDMISIGLLDEAWLKRLSPVLRLRLEELLNDPDG